MSHLYSNQKKKKTHYKTPCLNVTSCIKIKNGKQIRNTRLCDGNRKKCKSSLQAQKKKKNQQSTSKFFTFLFDGIYSVCQFLYFYDLLFAFIHNTLLQWQKHELLLNLQQLSAWDSVNHFSKFIVTFLAWPFSILTNWYL